MCISFSVIKMRQNKILYINVIFLYNTSSDWSKESLDRASKLHGSQGIKIMSHLFGNLRIFHPKGYGHTILTNRMT